MPPKARRSRDQKQTHEARSSLQKNFENRDLTGRAVDLGYSIRLRAYRLTNPTEIAKSDFIEIPQLIAMPYLSRADTSAVNLVRKFPCCGM